MEFNIAIHTDKGIRKSTNQDSLCIKEAHTSRGNVLMAVICDGMGGLEKGELASATIINEFCAWFETVLPCILLKSNCLSEVEYHWNRIIKEQNQRIGEYGRNHNIQLGTTVTAILFLENGQYIIGHVGDTRAYKITQESIVQLTEDQTVIAKDIKNKRITEEQAKTDPRRNVLLQCIGASKVVEPAFTTGTYNKEECYMLCSDGFRHVLTNQEIHFTFLPSMNSRESIMKNNVVNLIELNKQRGEDDNISSILIKVV